MLQHVSTCAAQLGGDVDLRALAEACHGYSGADLAALAREAVLAALAQATGLEGCGGGGGGGAAAQAVGGGEVGAGAVLSPPLSGGAAVVVVVVAARHFQDGMRRVGPSIVRGVEAEVPSTRCA